MIVGEAEDSDQPVDLTKVALVQIYSVLTTIRQMSGHGLSKAIADDMDKLGATLDSLLDAEPDVSKQTRQ